MSDDVPTELLTASSGSVGDVVASHNQHGPYFRARTAPTDPATARQLAVRAALSQCVTAWNSTLTQPEREAWDRFAVAVPVIGPLGRSTHAGGLAMFVRANVPRIQASVGATPRVDPAPTLFDSAAPSPIQPVVLNVVDGTIHPYFDPTDAWASEPDAAMLFYVSAPTPLTTHFWGGPYRFLGSLLGQTPPLFSPATINLNSSPTVNQRIFVRARVTRADARLSPPIRLPADIVPQVPPVFDTASIAYGPPPLWPMTLTVVFDSPIKPGTAAPGNWIFRYNDYRFDPYAAAVVDGNVALTANWGPAFPGPNRVWYFPARPHLFGLLTGLQLAGFSSNWP